METLPRFDCHCHILPGLDDGAADIAESLLLCRWLEAHGYTEAVCTSHSSSRYRNTAEIVEQATLALQQELDRQGIALRLHPSLEYRLIPQTWRPQRLLPWQGNHILIELPLRSPQKMVPIVPEVEIRKLLEDGYQPVLAHPERYLWATLDDYELWHASGALFQRNLGSVDGFYGSPAAQRAKWLLAKGYYSFLGTDMHNKNYMEFFNSIPYNLKGY